MFTLKTTLSAADGLALHVTVFDAENARAIVQITHGALEHKELYYPFAEFLNQQGYAVVISDNRAHGDSVNESFSYGHMEGIGQMAEDSYLITKFIKERYPDKQLVLFGHSLGSVLVRNYLMKHDDEISVLVMTGTANYVKPVRLGILLGKLCILFNGKRGHSRFFNLIGGSTIYHKMQYEDNWVTTDREFFDRFINDPKSGFAWDNSGALTVFEGDSNLKAFKKYQCLNPELKIGSFTGEDDPIVGGEDGLNDTLASLRRIGYSDIYTKVYPGKRHAVLFETNRDEVYNDILYFIDRSLSAISNRFEA